MDGKINLVTTKIYQKSVPTYPHIYNLYHNQNLEYFSFNSGLIFVEVLW